MTFTVAEVAAEERVSVHTTLKWIAEGWLKAHNVSRKPGGRPTWRITEEALRQFRELRTPGPPPVRTRRRKPVEVETFY